MATGKEIRAKLKEEARERARLESMEERQAKAAAPGSEGYKPTKTDMGPNMSQVNKPDSKKATTKATTKTPIVTKKQLEDSGFTNLRDYLNNKKGLTRRDSKAPERTNNKPESTTKSQDAKLNKSNAQQPDFTPKPVDKKVEPKKVTRNSSTIDKIKDVMGFGRKRTAKEDMGYELQNKARASMGMKHGGSVGNTSMGKVRTAKPRNINGIAKRGLTRAKHR